jgi:hypothetical protein
MLSNSIHGQYALVCLPLARAFRSPAFTRSTMSERSNSATAPRTVKTIRPAGVAVSSDSDRLTNSIPSELNVFKCAEQVGYAPSHPIKFPNGHNVHAASVRVCHLAVKLWPLFLRPADADVDVLASDGPAAALGIFPYLAGLHGGVLPVVRGAYASINCYLHRPSPFM